MVLEHFSSIWNRNNSQTICEKDVIKTFKYKEIFKIAFIS